MRSRTSFGSVRSNSVSMVVMTSACRDSWISYRSASRAGVVAGGAARTDVNGSSSSGRRGRCGRDGSGGHRDGDDRVGCGDGGGVRSSGARREWAGSGRVGGHDGRGRRRLGDRGRAFGGSRLGRSVQASCSFDSFDIDIVIPKSPVICFDAVPRSTSGTRIRRDRTFVCKGWTNRRCASPTAGQSGVVRVVRSAVHDAGAIIRRLCGRAPGSGRGAAW